jgi:hypothetical protein
MRQSRQQLSADPQVGHELRTPLHTGFGRQVGDVALYGPGRQEEVGADLPVRQALGEKP